jgi:hypothetical protein
MIHERALNQGINDPLKPDYTIFLAKRGKSTHTDVVKLSHAHLANLTDYILHLSTKAATKLQSVYRGSQARRRAELKAKQQAFLEAREFALKEMQEKITEEFRRREEQTGLAKMKWDAQVLLHIPVHRVGLTVLIGAHAPIKAAICRTASCSGSRAKRNAGGFNR